MTGKELYTRLNFSDFGWENLPLLLKEYYERQANIGCRDNNSEQRESIHKKKFSCCCGNKDNKCND